MNRATIASFKLRREIASVVITALRSYVRDIDKKFKKRKIVDQPDTPERRQGYIKKKLS